MTETVYTATREITLQGSRVVSVDANGGSVQVQCRHGDANWITVTTFSSDTAQIVDFGANRRVYRFVVSGGASFAI